jgi:hypothetical protein
MIMPHLIGKPNESQELILIRICPHAGFQWPSVIGLVVTSVAGYALSC